MRVASIGRDNNLTVPSLESTLDAGRLLIQALEVCALYFLQHAIERYYTKE